MNTLIRIAAAGVLFAPVAWGAVSPQEAAKLGAGPHAAGRREGRQRRRQHSRVGRRHQVRRRGGLSQTTSPASITRTRTRATSRCSRSPRRTWRSTPPSSPKATRSCCRRTRHYKMIVYPTHRSAAAPQRIYDATKRIATTAQLAPDGNGVTGAVEGMPFPIPKSGVEVFWNHVLRYRGDRRRAPDRPGAGDGRRRLHDGEVQGRVLFPVLRSRA